MHLAVRQGEAVPSLKCNADCAAAARRCVALLRVSVGPVVLMPKVLALVCRHCNVAWRTVSYLLADWGRICLHVTSYACPKRQMFRSRQRLATKASNRATFEMFTAQ
eukprot:scaffold217836_cov22-Tisochrysis_lutea.AAC.1